VIWAVAVVGWSLLRATIVWAVLSDYGVNPWAYLLIDLASAGIDAITTPKFVLALIDSKYHEAGRWGFLTLFAYVMPDVYIFKTTRELPKVAVMIICIVISLSLLAAVVGVIVKVRAGKKGPSVAAALPGIDPHD
jgi:dolichol kinase